MIRVTIFLVCVGLLALGAAWFVDRPGDVAVTWLGYRIETSVTVVAVALLALVAVAIFVWSLVRFIWRSPEQVSLFVRNRRAMRGYHAISRGLIAIGSGDAQAAARAAGDARRLSPHEPLTLLLSAQAAQLSGAASEAETAFRAMTERRDTRLLGLRGLFVEAERHNDRAGARRYAEAAAKDVPGVNWASQAVLDFRCADGDWPGALERLELMRRDLDKSAYRRQRAVLLTARALALADSDRDTALDLGREAVKLAPSLVPAAVFVGRRLAEAGERRKAARILDAAWRANPHPDLADAYAATRLGASARERLARVRSLTEKTPGTSEGALALARAAIEAREFNEARTALTPYLPGATRRVALLMAAIEDGEGDAGRAREWMARALNAAPDPMWTADGIVSETWLPVSPVTGRLDAFEWKVPVQEIGFQRPVIDVAAATAPAIAHAEAVPGPAPEPTQSDVMPADAEPDNIEEDDTAEEARTPGPAAVAADIPETKPAPVAEPRPATPVAATSPAEPGIIAKPAEPVIPLVQAPDDPGLGGTGIDERSERERALAFSAPPDSWPAPKASDTGTRTWFQRLFG